MNYNIKRHLHSFFVSFQTGFAIYAIPALLQWDFQDFEVFKAILMGAGVAGARAGLKVINEMLQPKATKDKIEFNKKRYE